MGVEQRCDVLVIGAGPCGLAAATLLATSGHSVILIDRKKQPRPGVLILTPRDGDVVNELGWAQELSSLATAQVFAGHRLVVESPHERLVLGDGWQVLAVSRQEALGKMAEMAEQRGVTLLPEHSAVVPVLEGQRLVGMRARDAAGRDVRLSATVVVDASGAASFLASAFGLLLPRKGPKRYRLLVPTGGEAPAEHVLALACRGWLQLVPAAGGWLAAIVREREAFDLDTLLGPLKSLAPYRGSVGSANPGISASAPRVAAGDGWVAVGDAAGSGCPGPPGATSTGLALAASAAWEIDLALQHGPVFGPGQLGATLTLRRQVLYSGSLLDRALPRAADTGMLGLAVSTPRRRRVLTSLLQGRWVDPRGRIGRILYLWWLDHRSRKEVKRRSSRRG